MTLAGDSLKAETMRLNLFAASVVPLVMSPARSMHPLARSRRILRTVNRHITLPVLTLPLAVFVLLALSPLSAAPRTILVLSCESAYFPAINNLGEIAYVWSTEFETYIASTFQGPVSPHSTNVRFPDLNDEGEIIYTDLIPGRPGLALVSVTRGPLFNGNLGAINRSGQISAGGQITFDRPPGLLFYDSDGSLYQVIDSSTIVTTDISDSAEITYVDSSALGTDIFSTTRGQLTFSGRVATHAANNSGRFIYTVRRQDGLFDLMSDTDEVIWNGVSVLADINDYGDIVLNVPRVLERDGQRYSKDALVLITSRPAFFRRELNRQHVFRPRPASRDVCSGE